MNPVEDALIRRLDARRAFADALSKLAPRNRSILLNSWRQGFTLDEISKSYGLSRERVRQVCKKGLRRVSTALEDRERPSAVPLRKPPPGFDKAAFLRHMRLLIKLRAQAEAAAEETDYLAISNLVRRELKPQPIPQAPPKYTPYTPPAYVPPPYVPPPPPMAAEDLATEALHSFMRFRQPTGWPRSSVGERCSTVSFTVTGRPTPEELDEAMRRVAVEIPHDAVLSAGHLIGNTSTLATASNAHVAVQALIQWHNPNSGVASYRLAITWDYAQPNA